MSPLFIYIFFSLSVRTTYTLSQTLSLTNKLSNFTRGGQKTRYTENTDPKSLINYKSLKKTPQMLILVKKKHISDLVIDSNHKTEKMTHFSNFINIIHIS